MSYNAWEITEDKAIEQVAIFCRHLLSNQKIFDDDTNPPVAEVEIFLNTNYAKMVGLLSKFGIVIDQTDDNVILLLQSYQVYMTAVDVLLTQTTNGMMNTGTSRFKLFQDKVKEFEMLLENGNLQSMPGVLLTGDGGFTPFATGTSYARKDALNSDPDLVKPDITRDMMKSGRVSRSMPRQEEFGVRL